MRWSSLYVLNRCCIIAPTFDSNNLNTFLLQSVQIWDGSFALATCTKMQAANKYNVLVNVIICRNLLQTESDRQYVLNTYFVTTLCARFPFRHDRDNTLGFFCEERIWRSHLLDIGD